MAERNPTVKQQLGILAAVAGGIFAFSRGWIPNPFDSGCPDGQHKDAGGQCVADDVIPEVASVTGFTLNNIL